MNHSTMRQFFQPCDPKLVLLLCILFLAGCGRAKDAGSFQVSGKVTHAGKPVPLGNVKFLPNSSEGNRGPASVAKIERGEYSTPSGKSLGEGTYDVEVTGFDGVSTTMEGEELPNGQPLFAPYYTKVTISADAVEHNFDVPAAAE